MSFQPFLDTLSTLLQNPGLRPDENGACKIIMKGSGASILFEYDEKIVPGSILLSTPVAPLRPESRNNMLKALLMGNWDLDGTLSKHPEKDEIFLHQRLDPEIELESLGPIIESFVYTKGNWEQKLASIPNDTKDLQ